VNWLALHYEWVVVVIVMPIALLVLKRFLETKKTTSEVTKTPASLAAGAGSTHMVGDIHAREVHFSPFVEAAPPVAPVKPERPPGNIRYIGANTISLEEIIGGLLFEKGELNNGIVIRFANEPNPENVAISVKAVLRYSLGEHELCEASGLWLGSSADVEEFEPDGRRHTLIAGVLRDGELVTIETERIAAHRRMFLQREPKPLKDFKSGTLFVRLMNARSNQVLYEGLFLVDANPLSIVPKEAIISLPGTFANVLPSPSSAAPIPNLQYVTSKEKRVFVSPLSQEGICDPHNEEEHENSVQALVLKFENRVLPNRKIANARDVIAKLRFMSKDGLTQRVIDYGVWLNSPCNCVDMGAGDTRELVLMGDVNNRLLCFEDRREGNHQFYDEFSYLDSGPVDELEIVEITLIDKRTQATLNCRFKIWRDGLRFCVANL
jgi:hypothetical protein